MVFFRCWLSVYSSFTSCMRSLTWGIRAEREVAAHGRPRFPRAPALHTDLPGFSAPLQGAVAQAADSTLPAALQGAVKTPLAHLYSNPTATPPKPCWAEPPFPHL